MSNYYIKIPPKKKRKKQLSSLKPNTIQQPHTINNDNNETRTEISPKIPFFRNDHLGKKKTKGAKISAARIYNENAKKRQPKKRKQEEEDKNKRKHPGNFSPLSFPSTLLPPPSLCCKHRFWPSPALIHISKSHCPPREGGGGAQSRGGRRGRRGRYFPQSGGRRAEGAFTIHPIWVSLPNPAEASKSPSPARPTPLSSSRVAAPAPERPFFVRQRSEELLRSVPTDTGYFSSA